MDVVNTVRDCVSTWTKGGENECRNMLISPHCNPLDTDCSDVLTTAYHTLLTSTLATWSPKHALAPEALLTFVQSILDNLPSSSSTTSMKSSNAVIFGELLVDIVWSLDAELDEVLSDAKAAITNEEQGDIPSSKAKARLAQSTKVRQNAEVDKEVLVDIIKRLIGHGIIDASHCRERLDLSLVAKAGLISDKASFDKKEIRTRTGLFYKQNKFNLLREQSEGYSKLTAELTSNLGPAHSFESARPVESMSAIQERVYPVWEKVISLIGYFDLDPNRALDVILDVLSVHLISHYTFFLALLSCSPWSNSSSIVLKTDELDEMSVDSDRGRYAGKSLDEVLRLAENLSRSTRNAPMAPQALSRINTRVMAQVLGFKFAYYQSPNVNEAAPRNLYLTAALLIREGFISLEDLYPHIDPRDEDMNQVHQAYMANVQSRIVAAKISQLAMAAPLESAPSKLRPSTPSSSESKKAQEPRDVPCQKVELLNALLAVGALRPAIAILSKFPWIVDAYTEIADLMLRIMKVSLSPLYESMFVAKDRHSSFTQPRARFGAAGMAQAPARKCQLTLWAPTPPSTSATDFVFFFPDWTDFIPTCSSLDDLVDIVEPFLRFIGLHVSRDTLFLTKFLRLGRSHLASTVPLDPETKRPIGEPDGQHPIRLFWFKVLRLYLLPALPLIRGNAVCTVEVWNIIRQYETTARWRLYGEWKSSVYTSHPELRIRLVQADRESKGILRRLSHNTIDTLSGTVAKLAHSNPCIFFTNAVNQIMAYDNLAGVVIQALRYVTNMGFDVLVFIILDALANPNKERVKEDGVNTSDWLQSLASFTGMLFRRYSADLTPVLKYVVHQLYNGQTTELVVLRELIWKMAGIEPLPSLSDSQIVAMAGGPALRIEAIASAARGSRLDPGDAVLKGPQRLGKSLLDSSLALPLLVQVAQQRQSCVFRAPDAHLKPLASLFDTTHGVLLQYLELLTSPAVISADDYSRKILPSLAELGEKYGISAPICMQIIRPKLNVSLLAAALAMQEQERAANEEAEKRLKAALTAKREPGSATSRLASPSIGTSGPAVDVSVDSKSTTQERAEDTAMETDANTTPTAPVIPESPWLPEISALFEDLKKVIPENVYDVVGPGFYTTFWQLSAYDLSPPVSTYDVEGAALRALSRQEDSKFIAADRSADRTKRLTASSHRSKRDRYNMFVNTLAQEFKEQTASHVFTIKRLAREKQHWFAHGPKAASLAQCLIEHCIQPRCLLSPMDADFCAQFIKVVHTHGTSGFPTLIVYDRILGEHVKAVVFSCSEYEARNYGRFLLGILTDLWKWQKDEQLFAQDNRMKMGGKNVLLPGFRMKWTKGSSVAPEELLTWSAFHQILRKWHRKLGKSFIECIQTGDFMHVYNAIIVLKEILPVFPLATVSGGDVGFGLDRVMEAFLENETRGDLKILGRAYAASLKKRESLWAPPKPGSKVNGPTSSPKPATLSVPAQPGEKPRSSVASSNGPNTTPATNGDGRRTVHSPAPAPSGPRAQLTNGSAERSTTGSNKFVETIPRPEVVRRVRPETRNGDSPKPEVKTSKPDGMEVDSVVNTQDRISSKEGTPVSGRPARPDVKDTRNDALHIKESSAPVHNQHSAVHPSGGTHEPSPRPQRLIDDKILRTDTQQDMPPPATPSQTLSAQELRETARQSRPPTDKIEERHQSQSRPGTDIRSQNSSKAPSPASRHRSPSPSTRPGTRNHSIDSRGSGGRSRSDRGSGDGDRQDEKRLDRDRQDSREHNVSVTRRDSINHSRGDRSARDRPIRDSDGDRDRDRGRDRRGERERDRDRDRDREKDKERDREKERERDRDRDRDRHRRDDKERDRDSRKDREGSSRGPATNSPIPPSDERSLPSRPDPSRHRNPPNGEDGIGKRRRPNDDDPDRSSKRSSRDKSHRDDRSRRPSEKEGHEKNRESERRRKDRDASENDIQPQSSEKPGEKRIPEGPAPKNLPPPSTPSAPRADIARAAGKVDPSPGRDRDWKGHRDNSHSNSLSGAPPASHPPLQESTSGSLRSRIGDKDISRSSPQASSNSYRPDITRKDDDRDGSRKRTLSDRDKELGEVTSGPGTDQMTQPPKRPRIIRNRYTGQPTSSHGIARKLLPIDPQAADKTRVGRKD